MLSSAETGGKDYECWLAGVPLRCTFSAVIHSSAVSVTGVSEMPVVLEVMLTKPPPLSELPWSYF